MDPNSTTEATPVDLQVPNIGDSIRHGGVTYTVQGVMLTAKRQVDVLETERHTLKFQITASAGPPVPEPEHDFNRDAFL